jgi:hypothetical protein
MSLNLVKLAAACLLAISLLSCSEKFPDEIRVPLEKAEQFELLSINPGHQATGDDRFHKWVVLGRMRVTDGNTRQVLLAALKKGVEASDGTTAACFNPRHGIRVIHGGKTTDFLICFQCLQIQVFADEAKPGSAPDIVAITRSPQPAFDEVLKGAKITLARDLYRP